MNSGQATCSRDISLERLWLKLNEACEFFGVEVSHNKSFIQLWAEVVENTSEETLEELYEKISFSNNELSIRMGETVKRRLNRLYQLEEEGELCEV
ncbi:hypothetical protein [Bacillus mesophilum]|uniref:Uncharacterized protein n=1 Tax=Bacillus mesophilum TaxID=1071718 RepID=A0A7V7UZT5_9BACI|nr:hypothetical protein [Bacillus mesophilum]KAB2334292.1 hypothetical protein F7732_09485 [Bacillus mesophilum]